jgi:hypothetical protein
VLCLQSRASVYLKISAKKHIRKKQQTNIDDADLRNIYNAATQLDYSTWLIWIMDEYKGMI